MGWVGGRGVQGGCAPTERPRATAASAAASASSKWVGVKVSGGGWGVGDGGPSRGWRVLWGLVGGGVRPDRTPRGPGDNSSKPQVATSRPRSCGPMFNVVSHNATAYQGTGGRKREPTKARVAPGRQGAPCNAVAAVMRSSLTVPRRWRNCRRCFQPTVGPKRSVLPIKAKGFYGRVTAGESPPDPSCSRWRCVR